MKSIITRIAITSSLLISWFSASAEETHLFILSGQSNMARMKPEAGFLPEAQKLLPGAEVVHVKIASPGKPIRNWLAEWDELATEHCLDSTAIRAEDKRQAAPYYDAILAATRPLLKKRPASISFVWMQGESDAKHGAEVVYEEALKALIAKLRNDLNAPEMNVVIGRISDYGSQSPKGENWPGWKAIRKAQGTFVAEDDRAALVNTDDCNGPRNGLHYPPEGYELMGRRMARQAAALIKGEKPEPNGNPN